MYTNLNHVNEHLRYQKVVLIPPVTSCYLHVAAEIDQFFLPFQWLKSSKKRHFISLAKEWCQALTMDGGVINASVFSAVIIPPGKGKFLKERDHVHQARFDVCILIEVINQEVLAAIRGSEYFYRIEQWLRKYSRFFYTLEAKNVMQIQPVDHSRQGIFLFNYFYGDNLQKTLGIWEYTAGYFQQETGLNNSSVLLPVVPADSIYTIINHCRWDRLADILPTLIFKQSFRDYVLAHFYANQVAPMPILYRLE